MTKKRLQKDKSFATTFLFYLIFLKKSIQRKEVILMTSLETTDIFRGAFFMCMGGDLEDIRFRQSSSQIASFMFTGNNLHKHDKAYLNGHALVNPVQFREALNHLRDILFRQLRDKRNTRYDRKRNHRVNQNQY
jgi:hypothetical protein